MNMFWRSKKKETEISKTLKDRMDELDLELDKDEMRMLSKLCPISRINCSNRCVHFKTGKVIVLESMAGTPYATKLEPKCRLWHW